MWHLSKNWHRCVFNICVSFGNWPNSQLSFYLHCRFLNSAVFSVILSKVLIWNIFFHLLLLEHFQIENFFFSDDNDLVSNYFSRREKKRGLLSIFQGIKESVLPSRSKKAYWLFNENNNSSNKRAIKSVFSTNEWFVQRPKNS